MSLRDAPPAARLLQFQKANGTIILAIWRAVPCWDVATTEDIPVAPRPVIFIPGRPAATAELMVLAEDCAWTDVPVSRDGVRVEVGSQVTLVRLKPVRAL